jgi:hypothetical protein
LVLFHDLRKKIVNAVQSLSSKASLVVRSLKQATSPLTDRLLAEALRLSEFPSPSKNEEQRVGYILERLSSLGLTGYVDEDGNVLARLFCPEASDPAPLLLFSDLGTRRWHPVLSFGSLNADSARGAGLADSLGPAALLSVAESFLSGALVCGKNMVLLFGARSFEDTENGVFQRIGEDSTQRPFAAIGLRGFPLGALMTKTLGTYRLEVKVRTDLADVINSEGLSHPSAVDAVVAVARKLAGVVWDSEKTTHCRIRRIEAGTGFGHDPVEGVLDLELESSDGPLLEMAMKAAVATAQTTGEDLKAKTEVSVVGHVPVGDSRESEGLRNLVMGIMKEQRIKVIEKTEADSSAFLSVQGIPALSIGLAQGREGLEIDEVIIESIERGRKLLASIIEQLSLGSI